MLKASSDICPILVTVFDRLQVHPLEYDVEQFIEHIEDAFSAAISLSTFNINLQLLIKKYCN